MTQNPDYGLLKGNLTQISKDTIESNQSLVSQVSSNSSFYEVDIQPENFTIPARLAPSFTAK